MANEETKFTKKEVDDGKAMAILSYIGILALIPYLAEKNNKFVIYHAKIGMNLFLLEVIASVALSVLAFTIILIPLIAIASPVIGIGSLVLSIIGIVNACNGEAKVLPVIEKFKIIK